jgi:cytoplasmic iron level regulating protein YaaA (DUF328/UPF0246 family)
MEIDLLVSGQNRFREYCHQKGYKKPALVRFHGEAWRVLLQAL